MLPVALTVRPPCGEVALCGDGCRANGFVPVAVGCNGCNGCCCIGANGDDDCAGGWANGDALLGDCDACWKPVVCLANGLVGDLFSELAPVGLAMNCWSADPVGLGIMDCLKGFVDVC